MLQNKPAAAMFMKNHIQKYTYFQGKLFISPTSHSSKIFAGQRHLRKQLKIVMALYLEIIGDLKLIRMVSHIHRIKKLLR